MKKIHKIRRPKQDEYIFSDGIDYSKTSRDSIWGRGDRDTLRILPKIKVSGRWLNLAAGDGRYSSILLKKSRSLVASDIDESALGKLWHNTPDEYKEKLKVKPFDITKKFPFKNSSFDGIFCTGTLHIFSREIFANIVSEINRVLVPCGKVIIDFATDVKRVRLDGKPYIIKGEPKYTMQEAKTFLRKLFAGYNIKMYDSEVSEELIKEANPPYKFSSKFILFVANKK